MCEDVHGEGTRAGGGRRAALVQVMRCAGACTGDGVHVYAAVAGELVRAWGGMGLWGGRDGGKAVGAVEERDGVAMYREPSLRLSGG